jgi:hypothetical protein
MAFHSFWNSPLLNDMVKGDGFSDAVPLYIVKGLPGLLLVSTLVWFARRREVVWFDDALRTEAALVPSDDLTALHTLRSRQAAVLAERRAHGSKAARVRVDLQRAQVRLAVAVARAGDPGAPSVEPARADVRVALAALEQQRVTGQPPAAPPATATPATATPVPPRASAGDQSPTPVVTPPPAPLLPAAWHPDPRGRYAQRFWDGQRWTSWVSTGSGDTVTDPAGV